MKNSQKRAVPAAALLVGIAIAVSCGGGDESGSPQSGGEGGQAAGSGGAAGSGATPGSAGSLAAGGAPGAGGDGPSPGGAPPTAGGVSGEPVGGGGAAGAGNPSASGAGGTEAADAAGAGPGSGGAGGDSSNGGQGGDGGCVLPVPATAAPGPSAEVLECGVGFVDQQEHVVGGADGQYFKTADDLRLGTCTIDSCTTGGTHAYGLDLFFLPDITPAPSAAQINIRGLPNDGTVATLNLRDYCTGELIDSCVMDHGQQWYADCSLQLPIEDVVATGMYYSLEVDIDSCFFIFDTIQLQLTP